MPVATTRAIGAILALAVGLAVLLSRRLAIRNTTLASAWWWSLAAVASWTAVELFAALASPEHLASSEVAALRLAAITLSLCPIVALLGAKRPQDKAWNLVVGSFWAMVTLPAAESYFLHRGQPVALSEVRGLILLTAVLLGPLSFSAVRYWPAAWLLACGQFIALSAYAFEPLSKLAVHAGWLGMMLSTAALALARLQSRFASTVDHPADRLWLDFRDAFGFFWASRVQQRFNAVSQQHGWDLELRWSGFTSRTGSRLNAEHLLSAEVLPLATLKSLLRRFVSKEWIHQRMEKKQPPDLDEKSGG